MAATPIPLIEGRRFDRPRAVEIAHNGRWWRARQAGRRLSDDGRYWRADLEWSESYQWGLGKHLSTVPPEPLRRVESVEP
jgi:hypothetical protein